MESEFRNVKMSELRSEEVGTREILKAFHQWNKMLNHHLRKTDLTGL